MGGGDPLLHQPSSTAVSAVRGSKHREQALPVLGQTVMMWGVPFFNRLKWQPYLTHYRHYLYHLNDHFQLTRG